MFELIFNDIMKKGKKAGPSFWISPQENFLEAPVIKFMSKVKHRRCNSGVISPSRPIFEKKLSDAKICTRQSSPKLLRGKKSCVEKSKGAKKGKKKLGNKSRKKIFNENKLADLKGSIKVKAPKIYENQIFRDIYDEVGNHDRVMETIELSLSLPEILQDLPSGALITPKDIENHLSKYSQSRNPKNPGSSFLQETKDCIHLDHFDLFKKLSQLTQNLD